MSTQPQQKQPQPNASVPVAANVKSRELTRPYMFPKGGVKQFQEKDFTIDSRELICLKYDDCILILFYNDNVESTRLAEIWADVSAQTPGITFGAVHLGLEDQLAKNFAKLNMDPNHPNRWAALQQVPFIMVYRGGWPTAFYNGTLSTQAIIDFSMTLACRADYHEHVQKAYSQQARTNIQMTGVNHPETQTYGSIRIPPRVTSEQFTTAQPLRGYYQNTEIQYVPEQTYDASLNKGYDNRDLKSKSNPGQTQPPKPAQPTQPPRTTQPAQPVKK